MGWETAISAGLQIFGAISSGNKQAEQSRAEGEAAQRASMYNAQIATENADIAEQQATVAEDQGAAQVERFSLTAQKQLGDMFASYGASGVSGTEGSALDVMAESAKLAQLDISTIKYKTALQAQGYRQRAAQFRRDAQFGMQSGANAMARAEDAASDAETAGWLRAGTSLFGSAMKGGWFDSPSITGSSGTGFRAPGTQGISGTLTTKYSAW